MMMFSKLTKLSLILACTLCLGLSATYPAVAGAPSAPAPSADDGRRRAITSSENFVPLPVLMATVQADFRAQGLLQIESGLEIPDAALRRRVLEHMPRLRDAYISALSLYTGMNYRYGDIPDVERITQLLQNATDHALGEEGATVLLGMVMIHAS
jgi:flagellar basal body-associated protein FliL